MLIPLYGLFFQVHKSVNLVNFDFLVRVWFLYHYQELLLVNFSKFAQILQRDRTEGLLDGDHIVYEDRFCKHANIVRIFFHEFWRQEFLQELGLLGVDDGLGIHANQQWI